MSCFNCNSVFKVRCSHVRIIAHGFFYVNTSRVLWGFDGSRSYHISAHALSMGYFYGGAPCQNQKSVGSGIAYCYRTEQSNIGLLFLVDGRGYLLKFSKMTMDILHISIGVANVYATHLGAFVTPICAMYTTQIFRAALRGSLMLCGSASSSTFPWREFKSEVNGRIQN